MASVLLVSNWVCHTAHPLFSIERKGYAQSALPLSHPPDSVEHKGRFFMIQVLVERKQCCFHLDQEMVYFLEQEELMGLGYRYFVVAMKEQR